MRLAVGCEEFQPILKNLNPPPSKLLNIIKCVGRTTVEEPCNTIKCTCTYCRYGLPGSVVCKNCHSN